MRTSFHHQPEAQHPHSPAINTPAGRLPHLLEIEEDAVRDRYRCFPVRFFLIGFLAFFAATLFYGTAFTFRERLVWAGLSLSSAANSSTPISEPVAATLAALATSLTASTSTAAIEARFSFAIFKAS
jgi:hypothetical protein